MEKRKQLSQRYETLEFSLYRVFKQTQNQGTICPQSDKFGGLAIHLYMRKKGKTVESFPCDDDDV